MRLFVTTLLCLLAFQVFSQSQPLYFPPKTGTAWQTTNPATLGFCQERIDSLYQFLSVSNTKSFILLQDGKIVLEKYFGSFTQDSFWYWASAGKSATAFLIGQAQDEGLLQISDVTSEYLGAGWTACTPAQEDQITLRHQLTMTTGLDDNLPPTPQVPDPDNCTDPACLVYKANPGTRWAYHNAPYHLLHDVLEAASGLTLQQFTKTRLLDKTGMRGLWLDHILYGRARDMARFGLLNLAGGVWDGDTLLHNQQYVYDMSHSSQNLNKSYGYLWWLNGQASYMLPSIQIVFPGTLVPNAPADVYAALGKNDQKIHISPSKRWVVVRQGNAAGAVGPGGNQVPIVFDNNLWKYLNLLNCSAVATQEPATPLLDLYPNPATDAFTLSSEATLQQVSVFDLCGRLLRQIQPTEPHTLHISLTGLEAGVYWVRVQTDGGIRSGKILVQR